MCCRNLQTDPTDSVNSKDTKRFLFLLITISTENV